MSFKVGDYIRSKESVFYMYKYTSFLTICSVIDKKQATIEDEETGELVDTECYVLEIVSSEEYPEMKGAQITIVEAEVNENFELVPSEIIFKIEDDIIKESEWIIPTDKEYPEIYDLSNIADFNFNLRSSNGSRNFSESAAYTRILSTDNFLDTSYNSIGLDDIIRWDKGIDFIKNRYEFFIEETGDTFENCLNKLRNSLPEIEILDEEKPKFKNEEFKIHAFKGQKSIIYLSNILCNEIIIKTALTFYRVFDIEISEDIRKSLIESNEQLFFDTVIPVIKTKIDEIIDAKNDESISVLSSFMADRAINDYKNKIERKKEVVKNLTDNLLREEKHLKELKIKEFYAINNPDSSNEFIDYLRNTKNSILNISTIDSSVYITSKTYLTYWDEELCRQYVERNRELNNQPSWVKNLYKEIFINKNIKLRVSQRFRLELSECYVSSSTDYNPFAEKWGIRNPHIHYYNCWGDYESKIDSALVNVDYIDAYAMAMAACSGIAWDDSCVADRLLNEITSRNSWDKKVLEYQDGTLKTIREFKEENK